MIPVKFEAALKAKFGNAYRKARGKNGLEFKICCPFCLKRHGSVDRGFKLSLNPVLNAAHCFRCEYSGTAAKVLGIKNLAQFVPPEQPEPRKGPGKGPGELVNLLELPDNHPCCNYIRGRGFSVEALSKYYGVMYCSKGVKFAGGLYDTTNTVVFPVWMRGELAGWQSRLMYNPDALTPEECEAMGFWKDGTGKIVRPPKYFTDPSMRKGECLYNFDLARRSELVVICEGTMDAMAVGPCAVATFGKGVTDMQARLVQNNWKLAAILLDPGDAAAEMMKLRAALTCIPNFIVDLKGWKDAGEAPSLEIWRQIYDSAAKAGHNLLDYKIELDRKAMKP